ncbi:MAG TPA: sulfatase [Rubrobacteraceae bacterium]|nr:sulfatase [Rubrobacteraceae bacterium]
MTRILPVLGGLAMLVVIAAYPACSAPPAPDKPNVVLILADDMRADDLKHTPETRSLLVDEGVTFENAFVTNSLCCPSRATILRGQYAHNHLIRDNKPPLGGWPVFRDRKREYSTLATWLDGAGYETALVGKYMNHYRGSHVPPGWDRWFAISGEPHPGEPYKINDDHALKTFTHAERDLTNLLADEAVSFMREAREPFFLYLAPRPPHRIAVPSPRHEDAYANTVYPNFPAYDEEDVSDKPSWVQDRERLTPEEHALADSLYRKRLRTLLDLDDLVRRVVAELEASGELENTYIIFTSDHGYHLGEHRLVPVNEGRDSKQSAYEEDIRIPLVVRGPGIPGNEARDDLVLNNDLAPTVARWAGVETPEFVDGRPLTSLLSGEVPRETPWRESFTVEKWGDHLMSHDYRAVRTQTYIYVEYSNGERELYDLRNDPYQLRNVYDSADPSLLEDLRQRLGALKDCAGDECRAAENGGS